jgi:hypothetical protein
MCFEDSFEDVWLMWGLDESLVQPSTPRPSLRDRVSPRDDEADAAVAAAMALTRPPRPGLLGRIASLLARNRDGRSREERWAEAPEEVAARSRR